MRRKPISEIGPKTLLTFGNVLEHPDVKQHGITRYRLDEMRKAGQLWTTNISNVNGQPRYRTTLEQVMYAIRKYILGEKVAKPK